ncbi:ergothioneine biosynthesis protein EgtB [Sphingomonas mesophila]|uniref:ergothioneine biosynthesis protein EgtB n=1 Tax=Sphingomonas mesophila TaxID=2303576 RepID=UPI001966F87B|nr:ergothioneine biosynthesis protein EgtB [Sphingomonas mesophila]
MATRRHQDQLADDLPTRLAATRALTLALAEPLSDADATIQPHPDASPAKWHLAHSTWFFETFVLRDHSPGYQAYDERWAYLFNSYYEGEGERHERARRGMISRPSLDEVRAWRATVDSALQEALPGLPDRARALVELGIQHEQQHQELFLTDILATFAENPLEPAYGPLRHCERSEAIQPSAAGLPRRFAARNDGGGWLPGLDGIVEIGATGETFAYDCETPRHRVLLHPHAIAGRCVSNGEWREFMAEGGYDEPRLWLSEGWDWRRANGIERPLYWAEDGQSAFTLAGRRDIDPAAPVAHVSFYEADAFARWAGARLPTEAEWESCFATADPTIGNQLDEACAVLPKSGGGPFGEVWQWTGSAFLPYPGFVPAEGTVGEYNGKFMCGQFVLKGASCATPRGHSRVSYRNFFPAGARWQFTGVRLARDI